MTYAPFRIATTIKAFIIMMMMAVHIPEAYPAPLILDDAPPVYARITLLDTAVPGAPTHAVLSVFRQYCHFAHATFGKMLISGTRGKVALPTGFDDMAPWHTFGEEDRLILGEPSAWIPLRDVIFNFTVNEYTGRREFIPNRTLAFSFNTPALPAVDGNAPRPDPRRYGAKPDRGNLQGITARIELARAPAAEDVIYETTYTTDTSVIALALWGTADEEQRPRDIARFDYVETIYEGLKRFRDGLAEHGLEEGLLPSHIWTTTWLHHGYMFSVFDNQCTQVMMDIMRRMGFNTVHWYITQPQGIAEILQDDQSIYAFEAPIDPRFVSTNPWVEDFEERVRERIEPLVKAWKQEARYREGERIWIKLGDEIFLIPQEDILNNPASQSAYRQWLRDRGIAPDYLGFADEEAIRPIALQDVDSLHAARNFYYTSWYRQEETARWWQSYVEVVRALFGPGAYIGTESCYNGFRARPDYFIWSRMGFMDTMLHEYTTKLWVSPHSAIFRAVLHQSASRFGQETSGGLWCTDRIATVAGVEISGVTALMRGFHNLYTYQYYYPLPDYIEWSAAIGRINQLAAVVETYVPTAPHLHPKAEVAVLHSRGTEIWEDTRPDPTTGGWDGQGFGGHYTEKNMLISALAFQQVPVDLLPEEEVAARLDNYRVLYITDSHLDAAARGYILDWVRRGGVLCTVAGAAERDSYNQPHSIFDALGLPDRPVTAVHRSQETYTEYLRRLFDLPRLDTLHWTTGGETVPLEAVARKDRIDWPGARVLGRFEDGTPAAVDVAWDKGRIIHFGTALGAAYARTATESFLADINAGRQPAIQQDQRRFDPAFLDAYGYPLRAAGVTPVLSVSRSGVDGTIFERADGKALILLADYETGESEPVSIQFHSDRSYAEARLLLPSPAQPAPWNIPVQRKGDAWVLESIPLANIQAIEIRPAD